MKSHIQHIAIIGGGKMGSSLFHYLSDLGYELVWILRSDIERKQKKYHRKLNRSLKNGLISKGEFEFRMNHHLISGNIQELTQVDLVIECIREELDAKRELIKELTQVLQPNALIASNSSSILPEKMVENNELLKRVFGLHFFFPLETKAVVEVIESSKLSENQQKRIRDFMTKLEKKVFFQDREDAFILNRVMLRFQAMVFNYCHESGHGFEQIDAVSEKYLFPMGVFEMMDYIGLDLIYKSAEYYLENQNDVLVYEPILAFMKKQVESGYSGLSDNRGFYIYPRVGGEEIQDVNLEKEIYKQLIYLFQQAMNWAVEMDRCSKEELVIGLNDYLDTDINEWRK